MSNPESRTPSRALEAPGLTLPVVAAPVAAYVPATRTGNPASTSGQLPFANGELAHTGHIDVEVTAEEAKETARTCALSVLAAVDAEVGLDNAICIMKVVGFVDPTAGFTGQPGVINEASELSNDVFGGRSQHARSAVGTNQPPLGAPVEVEIIIEVAQQLLFLLP